MREGERERERKRDRATNYCGFSNRYYSTSQKPNPVTRQVNFLVNDGLFNSSHVSAYITIVSVNDPPVLMLAGGGGIDNAVFYVEGQREAVLLAPSLSIQGIILLMHLLYMHGISMSLLKSDI